ncbi:MAG: multicopper oxidase domain-containing protein [Acidobacteria bacterium]|nr:multicopper oxidase domain-containing protein [Acidobacteriota bacterium]
MRSNDRRHFLKLCMASVPMLGLTDRAFAFRTFGVPSSQAPVLPSNALPPFVDPLPVLKKHTPFAMHGKTSLYRMRMTEFHQQLHSHLPATKLWGYEAQYPGPVIEAMRGEPVEIHWENHLPTTHIFNVDPRIHGAMPPAPVVRTVPHLHGSRTASYSDGLPENWFVPGQAVTYYYPNDQQAAPLWYHDHAVGITRLNVYAGMSGFYLLRDAQELAMNLPSGKYEVPLILQDRNLDEGGQLVYDPTNDDGKHLPGGVWGPEFFGNQAVVNGAVCPYFSVEPTQYRLRMLNAANSRFFHLYFNLAEHPTDIPSLHKFHQIGSDGGLLSSPVVMEKVLLAPAERADVIIDFAGLEGKTVTLSNNATSPFPGWANLTSEYAPLSSLMQFKVTVPASSNRTFSLPPSISVPRIDPSQAVVTRDFVLVERMDAQGRSQGVRINNRGYDDPVTEFPKLGTIEKWRFINTTEDAHPMHLHLVQYQIVERQGFNPVAYALGKLQMVGPPRPPAANEAGWKDTAVVNPAETLTIAIKFEGFTGRYVYHCHMLEHEDNDMMRPFEVT